MNYRIGSIIVYTDFLGCRRTVKIEGQYDDIKNGRPGFDAIIISSTNRDDAKGDDVWGYDDQITMVRTF